jgi:hypothetical protein
MYRALIALALTAAAVSAQEPKAETLYFPTKVGDKRVYERTSRASKSEIIDTVIKVETKGNAVLVTTTREFEETKRTVATVYEVSAKGVFRVSTGERAEATPHPLLKLPVKAGESWIAEIASPSNIGQVKLKNTVGKEAEIEVPAGKFKAIPVETESEVIAGLPKATTTWYAPGVGVVKETAKYGKTDTVTVLKSFTPGK